MEIDAVWVDEFAGKWRAPKRFLLGTNEGGTSVEYERDNFSPEAVHVIKWFQELAKIDEPASFQGKDLKYHAPSRTDWPCLTFKMGQDEMIAWVTNCFINLAFRDDVTDKTITWTYQNHGQAILSIVTMITSGDRLQFLALYDSISGENIGAS